MSELCHYGPVGTAGGEPGERSTIRHLMVSSLRVPAAANAACGTRGLRSTVPPPVFEFRGDLGAQMGWDVVPPPRGVPQTRAQPGHRETTSVKNGQAVVG